MFEKIFWCLSSILANLYRTKLDEFEELEYVPDIFLKVLQTVNIYQCLHRFLTY